MYIPRLDYEDDEVEELYGVIKEILEEDGNRTTNAIVMGDWSSTVGDCTPGKHQEIEIDISWTIYL
jgi:hypothetical protein